MKTSPAMSFLSPICTFLRAAITRLSMVDGKPGLTTTDINIITGKVRQLSADSTSKAVKAQQLAMWIRAAFAQRLPSPGNWPWIPDAIGWAAVLLAKRLKLI